MSWENLTVMEGSTVVLTFKVIAQSTQAVSIRILNQVIILRFIEGLGHTEIARILEKSEVACRGIQFRALASLSKLLNGNQKWV